MQKNTQKKLQNHTKTMQYFFLNGKDIQKNVQRFVKKYAKHERKKCEKICKNMKNMQKYARYGDSVI